MAHSHESTLGQSLMGRLFIGLLSRLFCALPLRWGMAVGTALGWLWYHVLPVRRSLAHRQVRRALGPGVGRKQARRIVRASFVNLAQMAIEGLRNPGLTARWSEQHVRRVDFHHLDGLLARGKGVIAVSIHMGNFEFLGTTQTVRGYRINAIFKDIGAACVAQFWRASRVRSGLGQIPPRKARGLIEQALGRNEVVAFLIDQHLAPYRSVVCSFFGMPAATTCAPVRFALQTGAPIMPLFITREGPPGHHVIRIMPEFVLQFPYGDAAANLGHNTQRLNDLVEGWVRAYPEQWLWAHRRWKVRDRMAAYTLGAHLLPDDGGH
jgi:KDO2-lipid IV(A) lauroyltransferase